MHGRALKQAEAAHDSRAHRPRALRARPVLPAGRRHRDRPRAHHARRRRRCMPPAIAVTSRWCTRCRASRSRSSDATTKAMAALRQAERLASLVQADDVLATVCGNQANVMMLQHRYEQALALAERSVVAARSARLRPRARRRARHARPDLRAARRSRTRRGRAAPRARSAQPDSVPRDDRRGVRHARADSPDPRPLRHGERFSRRARAKRTAPTAGRRASGTNGRCACSARGSRCAAARSTRRSRAPTRSCRPARRRSTRCRRRSSPPKR